MSFCFEIKNLLADIKTPQCCKSAMIYGFALFGRSFSVKRICIQTENEKSARCYAALLKNIYGADTSVVSGGGKRKTWRAEVTSEADRLRILASVDFGIYDGSINEEVFLRDCCVASFVRGAFLACGHLADPDKCYRVDFSVRDESLAKELVRLLSEHYIDAHISTRGKGYTVYIKRNEMIGNLLALMGASGKSLEIIETAIIKSVKNNTNRARNCDSSNIRRTVEASIAQRKAIEYLKKVEMFESLPQQLISAAKLRLKYPEASLKELCAASDEPLTISGLNHRLHRIVEIYTEVNKRKKKR